MKKAETASEITTSRNHPETAGLGAGGLAPGVGLAEESGCGWATAPALDWLEAELIS